MEISDYWSYRDTAKAFQKIKESEKFIGNNPFLNGIKEFYTAGIYFDKNIPLSEKHYHAAENLLKNLKTKEAYTFRARLWHNYGTLQQLKGDEQSFMNITLKNCIPLAEKAENFALLAGYYTDIGMLFFNKREYQKSIDYYTKALEIQQKTKNNGETSSWIHTNMASTYLQMKRPVDAKRHILKAEESLTKLPESQYNAILYQVKSKYFNLLGQHRLALENVQKGIDFAKKLNLDYDIQTLSYEKAQLLKLTKNLSGAKAELLNLLNDTKFKERRVNRLIFLKELAEIEVEQGNYKQAYEFKNQEKLLSDSLQKENEKIQLFNLESKYNNEKKEKEVLILENKSRIQKFAIVSVSILLLLLSAFSGYAFIQRKKRETQKFDNLEQQKKIEISQALTEGEEQERERLAKELHDGLGGRLTGIKMKLESLEQSQQNPELSAQIQQLDESLNELRQTARNLMPETLIKFGLEDALKDYCINMQNPKTRISFFGNNLAQISDKNKQLNIYRIVQELVNNALKHSEAKNILVQCTLENGLLLIDVEDNGKGFNLFENSNNLGLRNIEKRVQMLNGTIRKESVEGAGTNINIECKI